jgi:predicted nucleotidyltransferase
MRAKASGQSALLLLDVAELLERKRVDYAVIGAMAAAVHGAIRATTDADALVSLSPSKLGKLGKVFRDAGFKAELRRGDADDPIPALIVVGDRHGNRVDLLGGLRGLDPEAFSRSITVPFLGTNLRIISREDFIAMKCFAGGPQHIADALTAIMSAQEGIDLDLLRRVARRFGRDAADVLEQVLAG